MILDAELPPKSPDSAQPTVRYTPGPSGSRYSQHISYSTFSESQPQLSHRAQDVSQNSSRETGPLLHQYLPQSMHDDIEPPAYDEINPPAKPSRKRFWLHGTLIGFAVLLGSALWIFYALNYNKGSFPPPRDPVTRPPRLTSSNPPSSSTSSLPSSTEAPKPSQAPRPPSGHLPDLPFVTPKTGRTDLCHPWVYSDRLNSYESNLDPRGHPSDRLTYTVLSLAPLHIEAVPFCSTSNGDMGPCGNDESHRFASGALQAVDGDVELPEIEVSLASTGDEQFQNLAICLMKAPKKMGTERNGDGPAWVLGLYELRGRSIARASSAPLYVSITITLPRGYAHNLSTRLNYFSQIIGPEVSKEHRALTFDTLQLHGGQGGGMDFLVQNVNVAELRAESKVDNIRVDDSRISKLIYMRSENGIIGINATLVQTDTSPPVRVDIETTFGGVSATTILNYSPAISTPQFAFNLHSEYNPVVGKVLDPRGTKTLLAGALPTSLPKISMNVTSRYALAQAVVPATYHGTMDLKSNYAAIVINDQASGIPGREAIWYERGIQTHRGAVRWNDHSNDEAGSVRVFTEYATARMLFLGLEDHNHGQWPREGDEVFISYSSSAFPS